jgi:prepilin-type processing-associated H-X9-DG protein
MLLWDGAPVTVTNTTFSNNRARLGGAAAVTLNASLTVTGSTLQTNSAVLSGGAIYVFADGHATIQNTNLVSNKIPTTTGAGPPDNGGGAISSKGTTSVTDSVLSQNVVTVFDGGAILVGGGTFNLTRSRLEGNRAANGGGLQVNGQSSTSITASTIRFNFTTGLGYGGGLAPGFFMSSMSVADSTIDNNSANYGAAISNGCSLSVTNCTISGNQAAIAGGGIYNSTNDGFPTASFLNSTFFGNGAPNGGNIYELAGDFTGSVILKNTIVAKSTNGGNLARAKPTGGTIVSTGYNLCDDNTCPAFLAGTGDKSGSQFDAKLGPLADNGGLTQTHLPQSGSAALDGGTGSGAPVNDQRGLPRPSDDPMIPDASGGNGSDIGAVEVQVPPPIPTPTPTPTPTAPPTILANISTRLPVQTGDNALIGGFIVTGTQPKKVIIRAIGPSLPIAGALADPTLELYQGGTLLESNDNWMDSPNKQAIIDSTIPPSSNLEAAIVRTLPANSTPYTAIVRGVNDGTGIGVVEAYDLDQSVDSKLANISTRGFVQTGDNVLIAGTIILGQAPQKVIVRAIGPSLGLAGALGDPTLQLVDGNGTVLEENDNWVDSPNKQAIIDSTIPPPDNRESAIVRTLSANGARYTAIVRGVGDTTGIGVVEVYALQ